jgi:hypothetical protein
MSEPLYQQTPVSLFAIDHNRVVALRRDDGSVVEIERTAAAVLGAVQGIRSLDQHALKVRHSGACHDLDAIESIFNLLWDLDLLRESAGHQPAASTGAGLPIGAVGIVTADRPAMVRRSLASVGRQLDEYGHAARIVLVDGSRDEAVRRANREALRDVGRARATEYVGPAEAAVLRHDLVRSGVPLATLEVGLTPGEIGGNRNLVTLLTAGEHVLMLDDDIVCDTWRLTDSEAGIQIGGHADLREWSFFETRAEALASLPRAPLDLLHAHREFLARPLAELLHAGGPLDVNECCPHILDAAANGTGEVRVTFAGLAGDSARYCASRLLFVNGPVKDMLEADEDRLRTALLSREVRRVARRPIVTHDPSCMSYCMSVANSSLVPPFLPLGRGEDAVFGTLMAFAEPDALFAHLSVGVVHDSHRPSSYAEDRMVSAKGTRVSELLVLLLQRAVPCAFGSSPAVRLRRFGELLVDVGSQPPDKFALLARDLLLAWRCQELMSVERELEGRQASRHWRAAFDDYTRAFRSHLGQPKFFVPAEFKTAGSERQDFARVQTFLRAFGEFVSAWPDAWGASAKLREARSTTTADPPHAGRR